MNTIISKNIAVLKDLCRTYKVKSMYVFGSAATGQLHENSDLDFLISFEQNIGIEEYSENYFLLHYQLESLFNRKIDLLTDKSLSNPYFIQGIEQTKQLIYAA